MTNLRLTEVKYISPKYCAIYRAVRYLELRGELECHPDNPNVVRKRR